MLSPQNLAIAQNAAAVSRTTPCSIQRKSQTSDGMGGQIDTWTLVASVLCSFAPEQGAGRGEQVADQRLEQQSRFIIRLPAGQDVTIQDRLIIAGVTYEVADVEDRTNELAISRVVHAVVVSS